MCYLELTKQIQEISSHTIHAIRFIGRSGFSSSLNGESPPANPDSSCWESSPSEGGYNEAFIIQNWANYGPLN